MQGDDFDKPLFRLGLTVQETRMTLLDVNRYESPDHQRDL